MKTGKWERIMPKGKSIYDVTPEEARQVMAKLGFPPLESSSSPECRVCHHKHTSWFEDKDGIICDWCLNDIPCPKEKK